MREYNLSYLLVLVTAVFIIGAAYLFIPEKGELLSETEKNVPQSLAESFAAGEENLPSGGENASESPASSSDGSATGEETQSGETPEVVWIGDSRVVFLGTSETDDRYLGFLSNDQIFAKFGGKVTDEVMLLQAKNAGSVQASLGVFWIGIKDAQTLTEDQSAETFLEDYKKLLSAYSKENPSGSIAILSILGTSVEEPDYISGQEDTISSFNACLKAYCEDQNYLFVDLSDLSLEEAFFPDGIHFTKDWMTRSFPTVLERLGLSD